MPPHGSSSSEHRRGARADDGTFGTLAVQRVDQLVVKALVVSFAMIMGDVFSERSSKMPFTDRNEAVETFLFE